MELWKDGNVISFEAKVKTRDVIVIKSGRTVLGRRGVPTYCRHARPCAGHPRLLYGNRKDVDGRDRPGHDGCLIKRQ
jgi:hypothetical protein